MNKSHTTCCALRTLQFWTFFLLLSADSVSWSQGMNQPDLAARLVNEANEPFPDSLYVRNPASGSLVKCSDAQGKLGADQRTHTSPSERLEAATNVRACLEAKKAQSAVTYAEGVRAEGGPYAALAPNLAAMAYAPAIANADATIFTEKGRSDFLGMSFGVGVGLSRSGKERITDATVAADGTLRVIKREKQIPRVILEAHYYGACTMPSCYEGRFGIGPFFGLAATNEVIDSFAVGVMFGRKDTTPGASGGFSVGIGAVLDREVKDLAKGFEEGKHVPAGETVVSFETRSKWSPLLFFTRTF